jgi:hypothetical protein
MEKGVNIMPAPKGHIAYAGCETGGRPLRFTKEFIENEAVEFEKWMKLESSVYFKEFAFLRGYSSVEISEWAQKNEKFREVYTRVKEWQEIKIAKGSLLGEYNSNFAKFFMSNVCNWSEKQETKLSGDNSNPLAFILKECLPDTKDLVNDSDEESDNQSE